MNGYFDIHSHILPGVDDGAKDMDETRRMLLAAYEGGIRVIVATPHYIAGREHMEMDRLLSIFEEVKQVAAIVSSEFQIILGNELLYSPNLIDALNKGDALTIDGTRYILVEFLPGATYRELWEGINHCIFAGYIPILAHTERYRCLLKNSKLVENLVESGAYIQLNVSSIIKKGLNKEALFGRSLLKRGLVHFLGTDTHSSYERASGLKGAFNFLNRKYGKHTVNQLLWENPMTMIEDKHL